jgi:hypothetical protein
VPADTTEETAAPATSADSTPESRFRSGFKPRAHVSFQCGRYAQVPLVAGTAGEDPRGLTPSFRPSSNIHFIVDRHPEDARVAPASPCSGHGFKSSSAIGEILADLARDVPPAFDLKPFALGRFTR